MNAYMKLLNQPYLGTKQLRFLFNNCSAGTVSKIIKQHNITRYPYGYSTDEMILKIKWLKEYVKRQEKLEKKEKQEKKADSQETSAIINNNN